MTTPGNANLGTAYGKVRIDYESTGVAKATKDVESLQSTLVSANKNMGTLAKSTSTAVAQINQFGAQTAKVSKSIKNPAEGVGGQVTKELAQAQKAIADFQNKLNKGFSLNANFRILPREITVDRAAFNGAVERWQNSVKLGTLTLNANFRIIPRDVQVDSGSLARSIGNWQRTQTLGINSGLTVFVRLAMDEQQAVAVAQRIRVTVGRILADQSQFGQQAMNNFSAGFGSATPGFRRQAEAEGKSGGGLLAAGLMAGLRAAPITAAVAGVGIVLKKGFDRLEGLDTAAAKLKALGFQTNQIKEISKNALASVDQTAFGLDEAFNAAASAIAAGIQPGKELTEYLKSVADNASLAGTSMQDMGDIFNEVAVEGRLTGEVVDSLQSRGVDVFGNLAKSMKVSQNAAREMVANGQVDFEKFRAAMNLNSGAAAVMGQTVSGSMKNLWASISRVGALLLRPLFGEANGEASKFAQAIQFVTNALKKVEAWLGANQDKVVAFWGNAGKAVLYFGKGVLMVADYQTRTTATILRGLAFITKGYEKVGKLLHIDFIEKNAKDAGDALNGWAKDLDDVNKQLPALQGLLDKGIDGIDKWIEKARAGGNAAGDLGAKFEKAKQPAATLADALKKFGIKDNEFVSGIQGTTTEFNKLIKTLKDKGAPEAFLNFVKGLRSEFTNGGSAVKSYTEAIEKLGDASASAEDKASALVDALKDMGVIPNDGALLEYQEQIQKIGDAAQDVVDPLYKVGDALVNVDGTFNGTEKNGRALNRLLDETRQKALALAASGTVDPGSALEDARKQLKNVLTQRGSLSSEAADKVLQTYFPTDKILSQIQSGGDPEKAAKSLFGDKPAQLQAVLELMTKQDNLLKQIVPEGTLKIPVEFTDKNGSKLGPSTFADQVFGISDKIKEILGVDPTAKTNANLGGSAHKKVENTAPTGIPGAAAGLTPNNLYDNPTGVISSRLGVSSTALGALNDPTTLNTLLNQNQDIKSILGPQVSQAAEQGKNFAEAFAAGIDSASEEVKQAIIRLAKLSEGLGNSPAPWGPLSGKGWTQERGKVFTRAYASGISSAASEVKGSVASMVADGVMPLDDRLTRTIKDMQDFSDLGKKFFDVGKQIADIAIGTLKFANDLSGGRLFPKHYVKDPNKIPKDSFTSGFNPGLQTPNISAITGAKTPAPQSIGGGQQGVADYIIQKAMSLGYTRDQANYFATQAYGESHLEAGAFGANTGDKTGGASGIFQFTPGTAKDVGLLDPMNAKDNIDAYFRLAEQRGLTPQNFTDPTQLGTQVSIGGPYHPANGNHRQIAEQGVQQFLQGFTGTPEQKKLVGDELSKRVETQAPFSPSTILHDSNGRQSDAAAQYAAGLLQQAFPELTNIGGARNDSMPYHREGRALDVMIPGWDTPEGKALGDRVKQWALDNAKNIGLEDVIWQDFWQPADGSKGHLLGRMNQGPDQAHLTHNHLSFQQGFQPNTNGANIIGPTPVTLQTASGKEVDTSGISAFPDSINDLAKKDQGLADILAGNGTPESRLQGFDSRIADLNRTGDPTDKKNADYLSGLRTKTMDQYGLKEAPSDLETAQSVISGASGIVSSAFATVDSTIKVIGATKDLGDTFVRGVKDTSDVNKVIDDFQPFIDLGSKIAQLTSDISGFAAGIVGAAGSGDTSGSSQAVAMALGAVSTISGLVSQGFAAANAVIDLGQEIARIAGKYIGRGITSALGFPGAQDMKFLLDTVTGQLQAYTSENPQDKNTFDTLGRKYNRDRYVDQRTGPANTFYIYQGPGQDPRDTMNDAMFAVKSSGQGAFGYAK